MPHPFWTVRHHVDAALARAGVAFHDFNDAGFEASLRERRAPKRAYGLPQLFADAERSFALAANTLAPLGSRSWLWYHDLLHAIADDATATVPAVPAVKAAAQRAAKTAFTAALARYADGDPDGALAACAPAAGAANADLHSLLALLHHDRWQHRAIDPTDLDLAHVELDTALSLGADDANTWQRAGHILRARKRYDAAEAAYHRVLALVGDRGISLHYNLGLLYEDAGRPADAIGAYETFCAGAGDDYADAVDEARTKLAKLRKPGKPAAKSAKPAAKKPKR